MHRSFSVFDRGSDLAVFLWLNGFKFYFEFKFLAFNVFFQISLLIERPSQDTECLITLIAVFF